jgi:hypothetical protein
MKKSIINSSSTLCISNNEIWNGNKVYKSFWIFKWQEKCKKKNKALPAYLST